MAMEVLFMDTAKGKIDYFPGKLGLPMYTMLKMTVMAGGKTFDKERTEDTFAAICQMMKQTAGYVKIKKKDVPFDNLQRLLAEAVCHAVALYLSGRLDNVPNSRKENEDCETYDGTR